MDCLHIYVSRKEVERWPTAKFIDIGSLFALVKNNEFICIRCLSKIGTVNYGIEQVVPHEVIER